jgi:hypothetical protein
MAKPAETKDKHLGKYSRSYCTGKVFIKPTPVILTFDVLMSEWRSGKIDVRN